MPGALDMIRPFLWLAAIAFLVGFFSYLVIGRPDAAMAHEDAWRTEAAAPVSDEWNVPKRI